MATHNTRFINANPRNGYSASDTSSRTAIKTSRTVRPVVLLSPEAQDRLGRAVAAVTAGILLAAAWGAVNSDTREVCTQSSRTFDGVECVGDYVTVGGRDWDLAVIWTLLAAAAIFISVRRPDPISKRDIKDYRRQLSELGIQGHQADRLVEHYRTSGDRYIVTEGELKRYQNELTEAGISGEEGFWLEREYLLTREKPPLPDL